DRHGERGRGARCRRRPARPRRGPARRRARRGAVPEGGLARRLRPLRPAREARRPRPDPQALRRRRGRDPRRQGPGRGEAPAAAPPPPAAAPRAPPRRYTERDGTRGRLLYANQASRFDGWNGRHMIAFASEVRTLDLPAGTAMAGGAFVFADILHAIMRAGPRS